MRSDTRVVWPRSGKSVEAEVASDTRWSGDKAARRLGPALLIVDRKHQSQSDPSIPIFRFLRTGPFAFPSSQRSRDSDSRNEPLWNAAWLKALKDPSLQIDSP